MELPLQGSCICNTVRFQLNAAPLFTHACHCNNCQKLTGSAFAMSSFVLQTDLQVLTGEPICIDQPIKSGNRKVYLCPACQTVVWAESGRFAKVNIIRPGVLTSKTAVKPQAHIWTQRRQTWLQIDGDIPQFAEDYVPAQTWPQASLDRIGG